MHAREILESAALGVVTVLTLMWPPGWAMVALRARRAGGPPSDADVRHALLTLARLVESRPDIENFGRWQLAYREDGTDRAWGFVVSRPDAWDVHEQVTAYKQALEEAGIDLPEYPAEPILEMAHRAGRRWGKERSRP